MPRLTFKEVKSELWPAFEKLFGDNGACGGCWCQHWRVPQGGKMWEMAKGENARQVMRQLFVENKVTGLLAFEGDKAIGWCSYGPRTDYPRIERTKAYMRDDTAGIWCINCFFIDKHYRHQGVATAMLEAALKFIKKRKVRTVEAYPVPLTMDGQKLPGAFVYPGPLKMFEDAGFKIIQRFSYSRPLVRKTLK
ncbi:MAG: GNAT family N-acetyltransferase [Candidatus Zixiibacteriota bacterium]